MRMRAILLTATMLHGASVALAQDASSPALAARALPGVADVVHGTVTFDRSNPGSLRVIQSSDKAIVNWQSFDIGAGNAVTVAQPGTNAAALFRVTGNTDSQIAGTLSANGQLFLINPNGIAFANGARVDAGSFVASTLDIADADFLSGTMQFRRNGQARGVVNAGSITAGSAVALLGSSVVNEGVVSARLGRIGYAAGDAITINFGGDNFLSVAVPVSDADNITDAFGRPLSALVQAGGTTIAEGGRIYLAAATARQLMLGAVKVDGTLVATTINQGPGGIVSLGGVTIDGGQGLVQLDGVINASSANGAGGSISISGGAVGVGGLISAAGDTGGTVSISGSTALSVAGTVDARGVRGNGGSVSYVSGGDFIENTAGLTDVSGGINGGTVRVEAAGDLMSSGTYLANGLLGLGGRIDLTGASVQLLSTQLAARGLQQGGLIRVGGGFMGGAADRASHADHALFEGRFGDLPGLANASDTFVNDGVAIDVSSSRGFGGSAIIWSDKQTTMLGSVRASGLRGGGAAEISGKEELRYVDLANIDTGMGGRVLLDPSFITIGDAVSVSSWQYTLLLGRGSPIASIPSLDLTSSLPANVTFGKGVALNAAGDRLVVSAQGDAGFAGNVANSGSVRLFTFTNSSFAGGALTGIIGRGYTGTGNLDLGTALESGDFLGNSLALNAAGDRLAVGANGDDGLNNGFSQTGSVRLFTFANTSFGSPTLAGIIGRGYTGGNNVDVGSGLESDDAFGVSLALNAAGDRMAVGSFGDDGAGNLFSNSGAIRLFTFTNTSFGGGAQAGIIGRGYTGGNNIDLGSGLEGGDLLGIGLAINAAGDRLAVGAFADDGFGASGSLDWGSVRLITFSNTSFGGGTVVGTIGRGYTGAGDINVSSNQSAGELMGYGIALNAAGDQLAVGAFNNLGFTPGSTAYGAVRFYSFSNTSFGGGTLIGTMGRGYTGAGNFDTTALGTTLQIGSALSYSADASSLIVGSNTGYVLAVRQPASGASPGNLTFATNASGTSNISVTGLAAALSTGQSISLEASNDITLQKALTVNNASGNGGALSLRAGRSILLNASITTDSGDLTLIANSGGNDTTTVNANRQAGAASITMASGTSINAGTGAVAITLADATGLTIKTSGNVSLNSITAGTIAISNAGTSNGNVVLNSGAVLTASGTGRAIDIQALTGNFTNNAGSGALVLTGGGTYGVLSETPDNTLEGVTGYLKRYGVPNASAFNALAPGGSFFAYRVQPSLSVFINNATRAYGDSNPTFTYSLAGFIDGDTAATALTGAPSLSSTATGSSGVGNYTITGSLGSLASVMGYNFIVWDANLAVFARPITVTANALSRVYGNANPALTFTVGGSGLVNGDTLSGGLATTATTASSVGSYAITQGTLAASSNYNLTSFTGANLSVTARPITVTANALSRVYGDANPALTYTVGGAGLVNGDLLSGVLATTASATSGVGSVAITQGTLAASSNYSLGFIGANLSITARPLTVTANAQSRNYGNANPALTFSSSGLVNSDTLSGSLATTATAASNVGSYAITQGSLGNSNYAISFTGANLSVTARPITVTANALSRVYGDSNPTLTFTVGGQGLVNGDVLSGGLATTATTTSNVGAYGITQGTLAASSNYSLGFTGANLSVTARPLTITANAASRIYGDANPAFTYSVGGQGLVNGDVLSGALATTATTASSVGSYAITVGSLGHSNYTIQSYTGANLGVTARSLTISANAQSRVYGEANPTLTYSVGGMGLVNGDTLSGALAVGTGPTGPVASYNIVRGTLGNSNYSIDTYNGALLTVTKRPITITATSLNRSYGDANPALTFTVGGMGLAYSDTLAGSLATTATTTSNVGSYAITQGTLFATTNYLVTSFTPGTLTVDPRSLAITANAQSRVYGNANPALTYTVGGQGLVNGDTLSGALATTATTTSNIGAHGITQGSLAASSNYTLGFTGANLTVTARPLTITADAQSRIYGNANPALTYVVGGQGLVNGDLLSGALATTATTTSNIGAYGITLGSLAASSNYAVTYNAANLSVTARPITITVAEQARVYGNANPANSIAVGGLGLVNGDVLTGSLATTAVATTGVGSVPITQGTLTAGTNYTITYIGANLIIMARPLTINAFGQSRIYGNSNPALTYEAFGLVNGDALSGGLATTATTASSVGSYAITQGTLAASSNYAINFTGANLAVTARSITVTANALSRIYGNANPALTFVVGGQGLVNGDTLSGALATTATATSNIGAYAIAQGTLAASSNYALGFTGANLTVTVRPLTISATALSRIYGEANPALTFTVGGQGLANGDTLSGALATTAAATSSVGAYGITQGSLSAGNNYAVTYNAANLTVTARPITLTADAQTRMYGEANPALTYTLGGMGLANGDVLTPFLGTAGVAANVGSFPIVLGNVGNNNYAVSYVGANLTVTQRPISIVANAQTRTYGSANPALTYAIGGFGLVNGDTLSGSLATSAGLASNIGTYGITLGTLAASGNYLLQNFIGADLVVTARPISVTANAQTRLYGNANPVLTFTVGGQGLVNGDTLGGSLATTATTTSNVGAYAITQGTLAAGGNYLLQGFTGANLTVAARPLTITTDNKTKVYGDATPALTYTVGGQGLVNGDTLTGALPTSQSVAGTFANAGSYAIPQGTLAASSNYAVTFNPGNLVITSRPLTVTANAISTVYGQGAPSVLGYTLSAGTLVQGDPLIGSLASPVTAATNVGTYNISLGSLRAQNNPNNYAITLVTANHTVTQRGLTITALGDTRTYGTQAALVYTLSGQGLVNGDTLSGALTTSQGRPIHLTDVGNWRVTRGSLTAGNNYNITFNDAALTITRRPLNIAINSFNMVYGDAVPALTYVLSGAGLVNGDQLTGALSTNASPTSNVGAYFVNRGTLSAGNNYTITETAGVITINRRPLTITALAADRYYGDANPALAYLVGGRGLANGDTLTGALDTGTNARTGVGDYAITIGSLRPGNSNNPSTSNNYAVDYRGANFTIVPRPLVITPTTVERIYGDPVLDYVWNFGQQVRTLPFTISGIQQGFNTLPGLVNGDTLSGVLGSTATSFSGVGQYPITLGTLNNPNYRLLLDPGYVLVRPAVVRVIPQAQQMKTYGQADPNFVYSVFTFRANEWLPGLKNGEAVGNVITGQLSRDAGNDVASYWIRQGTLAANPNYTIQFVPERFLINAARLTISAPTLTSVAGQALPTINLSYSGFVAPRPGLAVDTVATAFSVLPQASTLARFNAPGNYRIDINPGTARNYIVSTAPGWMMVVPPPPTTSCCIPSVKYTPGIKQK